MQLGFWQAVTECKLKILSNRVAVKLMNLAEMMESG